MMACILFVVAERHARRRAFSPANLQEFAGARASWGDDLHEMRSIGGTWYGGALAALFTGFARLQAAHAEDAAASPAEVVVTATKRETALLDTPISMTVLGSDVLQAVNADDFADYERLVPGLTAIDSGPGEKRYALRGLQSAGEPEVALYYDEIPISGLPGSALDTGDSQPDLKLFDVDRIEVLRGPQGTLYGNGSMGGAIRIISRRPDLDQFTARTEVEGAVTDGGAPSWGMSSLVNIPLITERLAVRLDGYYRHAGGWIDDVYRSDIKLPQIGSNNLNWEHTIGGRASVAFQATEQWNVTGIIYYQVLDTGDSFETYPSFALPEDPYVSKAFVRTPWHDETSMANVISTYDLHWANLVATGSYQQRTVDQSIDTTRYLLSLFGCNEFTFDQGCFTPPLVPAVSYAHEGVAAYSAEIRLVSRSGGPLEWTAGGFMQEAHTFHDGQVAVANSVGSISLDSSTGVAANRLFARSNFDTFDQYAFFGEGTYDLYHGLEATVGLRWFHSYRSDQQIIVQQFFPGQPVGPEPFQQFSESALFKKFQLSKELVPNVLLYTQAAQGFRAGGPNYPGGFTATAPPYRSDSVWDYEVGWKLALADRQVVWTGALFRINWNNLQQLVPTSLFNYITNAGSARSDGFETEINTEPYRGLSFGLGATCANAHLSGPQPMVNNPSQQLHEGERLGGVPKWTANASASYTRAIAGGFSLTTRVDYSFQSSRSNLVAEQNPAYFTIKGPDLVNLHLGLARDAWNVSLHVDNLFNSFAPLSAKALDSNLINTVTAAPPRTIGIRVSKTYP
jgi:iron complex outermembrane recepter protein